MSLKGEKVMRKIAIIGSGPRGMSVLERIACRIIKESSVIPTEILLIDNGNIGTGRIWKEDQSKSFIMNTIATEISAFSGLGTYEKARPGAGPSFSDWWKVAFDDFDNHIGYAPRRYYGSYLKFVYQKVNEHLPLHVKVTEINDEVIDITEVNSLQVLRFRNNETVEVSSTVIATGHSTNFPSAKQSEIERHATENRELSFISGDSAADMALDNIAEKDRVAIIGLGLSFYDIVTYLTEGRGGDFTSNQDGSLSYHPSGKEPEIFCGSRSGVPVLARGKNQKSSDYSYKARIFNSDKADLIRQTFSGEVDFGSQVWPLIEAEVTLVYYETLITNTKSEEVADDFIQHVIRDEIKSKTLVGTIAGEYLNKKCEPLDLETLARPFRNREFITQTEFKETLSELLCADIKEAEAGNVSSPLKAALDVLRNSRDNIRRVVDYGGLSAESHKIFLSKYVPFISSLCAGPPLFRIKQLLALMDAGVVSILGPDIQLKTSANGYKFFSGSVDKYCIKVNTVIDSRISQPNIALDKSELTCSLVQRGLFTNYINRSGQESYLTGGVNITPSPFHPIRSDGSIAKRIHILGIPTEHVRWFMQSGSSRPDFWIDFMIDADAISESMLLVDNRKCQKNVIEFKEEDLVL